MELGEHSRLPPHPRCCQLPCGSLGVLFLGPPLGSLAEACSPADGHFGSFSSDLSILPSTPLVTSLPPETSVLDFCSEGHYPSFPCFLSRDCLNCCLHSTLALCPPPQPGPIFPAIYAPRRSRPGPPRMIPRHCGELPFQIPDLLRGALQSGSALPLCVPGLFRDSPDSSGPFSTFVLLTLQVTSQQTVRPGRPQLPWLLTCPWTAQALSFSPGR